MYERCHFTIINNIVYDKIILHYLIFFKSTKINSTKKYFKKNIADSKNSIIFAPKFLVW